ncbi:MAG TPA: OsmC family protein [Anaerolineales bacterium]|nr:OsmC family protein [Anaerolineales bacterium]
MGTVNLQWVRQNMFVANDSRGYSLNISSSENEAGGRMGAKASDLLLVSAAACSSWDIAEIMAKQRQPMRDLQVRCIGEQMSDPPFTFTKIHIVYTVYGPVDPDKLEQAIRLSEDKYCSVISTLRLGIPVTSEFEICP